MVSSLLLHAGQTGTGQTMALVPWSPASQRRGGASRSFRGRSRYAHLTDSPPSRFTLSPRRRCEGGPGARRSSLHRSRPPDSRTRSSLWPGLFHPCTFSAISVTFFSPRLTLSTCTGVMFAACFAAFPRCRRPFRVSFARCARGSVSAKAFEGDLIALIASPFCLAMVEGFCGSANHLSRLDQERDGIVL